MRHQFLAASSLLLGILALAACMRAPQPAPQPRPAPPRPAPAPIATPAPPSSDWRDWSITPGAWSYRADSRGSVALFGVANADPDFTLRCDKGANAVYLSRHGEARGTGFTIRTSTMTRALPTQGMAGAAGYVGAVLTPEDRLLDAIGYSRGRFVVEAPPLAALALPAWPEVLRVVEDCRN